MQIEHKLHQHVSKKHIRKLQKHVLIIA